MITATKHSLKPHTRNAKNGCDPARALVIFSKEEDAFVLESVCNTNGYGRYTVMGFQPINRLDIDVVSASATGPDALEQLAHSVQNQPVICCSDVAFAGGWVGYIPYETGTLLEGIPPAGKGEKNPRLRFALYDSAAIFDHQKRIWQLVAVDLPGSISSSSDRLDKLEKLLTNGGHDRGESNLMAPTSLPQANLSHEKYLDNVRRAIRYIAAGDIYEVNLTQRFTTKTNAAPLDLYLRLRQANPAAYAALLNWGEQAVLSSSPELFLDVSPAGEVVTRPIKGTRRRSDSRTDDKINRMKLAESEKDLAELNMIVDLLRNDLGKVCEFGSVQVVAAHDVEDHPTVHHLVSTIRGQLRSGVSAVELLRASFPGGSITGCPKIRAMEIIRELEPTPRDVYCGSIGYIGLDGRMLMNIAIRTMFYDAGELHIYAGGAITADSNPEAEYQETLAKAEGMFRSIGHSTDGFIG